jgi:hypothetical protein
MSYKTDAELTVQSAKPRPVLALDIDGVIFPLAEKVGDRLPEYEGWVKTTASGLPVSYEPELVKWLQEICSRGVDIVWASSWGKTASASVSELLGLPELAALDVSQGRWPAVSAYAKNSPLIWCEDARQSAAVKAQIKAHKPSALLIQPKRHLALTPAQRKKISTFLDSL